MMPAMPMAGNSKTGPFRPIKKSASDKERAHSAKATLRKSLQKAASYAARLAVALNIVLPKEREAMHRKAVMIGLPLTVQLVKMLGKLGADARCFRMS
jgi:hypothetical protein